MHWLRMLSLALVVAGPYGRGVKRGAQRVDRHEVRSLGMRDRNVVAGPSSVDRGEDGSRASPRAAAEVRVDADEGARRERRPISERELRALIDGRGELMGLREAERRAVRRLCLANDEEVEGWATRSRLRGLLPRVDFRVGRDMDRDIRDSLSSSQRLTRTEGQSLGFDVDVRFELGRLVFDESELRAHRERIARAQTIRLVRERVADLYFQYIEVWVARRHRDGAYGGRRAELGRSVGRDTDALADAYLDARIGSDIDSDVDVHAAAPTTLTEGGAEAERASERDAEEEADLELILRAERVRGALRALVGAPIDRSVAKGGRSSSEASGFGPGAGGAL